MLQAGVFINRLVRRNENVPVVRLIVLIGLRLELTIIDQILVGRFICFGDRVGVVVIFISQRVGVGLACRIERQSVRFPGNSVGASAPGGVVRRGGRLTVLRRHQTPRMIVIR